MSEDTNKKKPTLKKAILLLAGILMVGFGSWIVYERFFYVDPSIKGSLEFWTRFNEETKK